jgi:hypothetical protein
MATVWVSEIISNEFKVNGIHISVISSSHKDNDNNYCNNDNKKNL